MTSLEEARSILKLGGSIADIAEAIAMIISDPSSSEADIRLGLQYPGFIAEQAEFALRRRGLPRHGQSPGAALPTHTSDPVRDAL
jgi:hypothetical protein